MGARRHERRAESGAKEQYEQWACFMPAESPRKCRQQPLKALFPAPEAAAKPSPPPSREEVVLARRP
ncbi:hypothetical protein MTO96_014986 [Rhipicephalus appendiculatus]